MKTRKSYLRIKDLENESEETVFEGNVYTAVWHPIVDVLVFSGKEGEAEKFKLYGYTPGASLNVLYSSDGNVISPSFDVYGHKIVFVDKGEVVLADFRDGKVVNAKIIGTGSFPAVSPDGKMVAYKAEKSVAIWKDGKVEIIEKDSDEEVELSWSPSGEWLVFCKSSGGELCDIAAYNVLNKKTTIVYKEARREFGQVVWIGRDEFLFGSTGKKDIGVYSLKEKKVLGKYGVVFATSINGRISSTKRFAFVEIDSKVKAVFQGYASISFGRGKKRIFRHTVIIGSVGK